MNMHKFSVLSVNRQCEKRLILLMTEQDTGATKCLHMCYEKIIAFVFTVVSLSLQLLEIIRAVERLLFLIALLTALIF